MCPVLSPWWQKVKSCVVDLFKDIISEERAVENQKMFISLFYGILNRGLDDASVPFL